MEFKFGFRLTVLSALLTAISDPKTLEWVDALRADMVRQKLNLNFS